MKKIVYMEWVKQKKSAKYEIGGSGVVPVHIAELPEARAALDINDFNLYGYRPLVSAIAARYKLKPEEVVTTQGCSMANYLACAVVLKRGDEVLVESPAYEPLLAVPKLLGARIHRFKRRFKDGYKLDPDEIASRMTKKTRLIILSNMHNPSGVLTSNDVLAESGRIARKNKAYVLVDEVYLDFLFENRPASCVTLGDNFLATASLTKAYGFDGLRCGWVFASPKLAEEVWRLQDFYGVNGTIPAEKTATVAFEYLPRFVERTRAIISANRDLIDVFMAKHEDQLAWVPPDGGPVCFPRLRKEKSAGKFIDDLLAQYNTRVIPGSFFESPAHFRLGFGGNTKTLQAGLKNLAATLKP